MQPTTLTVSSVGQITIPKSIRKLLDLKTGTKLDIDVDKINSTITLKRHKTHEEIFAELEALHKTLPKPDPSTKNMTVNEMVKEELKNHPLENDTWV